MTTRCSAYQHREFRLDFEAAILLQDVDLLSSLLEQSVAGGVKYEDGETIEFGSSLFQIACASNCFTLLEPDFWTFPIVWVPGITRSMSITRLQRDIADSVGLIDELNPPSIRLSLLVGTDVTAKVDTFVLDRSESAASDSGWFVGRVDSELNYNNDANLQRMSVYQAVVNWPQIAGFLGLPAGCRVDISQQSIVVSRYGLPLKVHGGSILDRVWFPSTPLN